MNMTAKILFFFGFAICTLVIGNTGVQATPPANIPPQALEHFRMKAWIKDSSHLVLQDIPHGAPSFALGGKTIDFASLEPMTGLFSTDAIVMVNGKKETPHVFVYESPHHPDLRVILDEKKNLIKAYEMKPGRTDSIDLLPIDATTFAEVDSSTDVNKTLVAAFEMVR